MNNESAFSPFKHKAFAVIWTATVLSNIGTWMHDVGAGWTMATMSPSPVMVALVQTATTLPVFLFALPSGALADLFDRRRLLLIAQTIIMLIAFLLGYIVYSGHLTPELLLLFTFLMGAGAAFSTPSWQAIVPSLVPASNLQHAISLNSVGLNISRAIGPALAGIILVKVGPSAPFIINGLSFVIVVGSLLWWAPQKTKERRLPSEDIVGAMKSGLRYAMNSRSFKNTVIRAIGFFIFASSYWAVLPLVAKVSLKGDSQLYGILLGSIGLGAVLGALILPKLKKKLTADHLLYIGTIGTAISILIFATTAEKYLAVVASIIAGAAWISALTTLNVSAQTSLPDWVRARGLAIFVMAFFGSQTLGSLTWGKISAQFGIPMALLIAASGLIISIPLTWRFKLHQAKKVDLSPSMHWPTPILTTEVKMDKGPVMITIEYMIDLSNKKQFVDLLDTLSEQRRRDGAYAWGLFEDTEKPGKFLEYFLVSSWLEHLRQHDRVTNSDSDVQEQVRKFHILDEAPIVKHLIAPK